MWSAIEPEGPRRTARIDQMLKSSAPLSERKSLSILVKGNSGHLCTDLLSSERSILPFSELEEELEEDFGQAWKLSGGGILYSGIHAPAVSQGAGWAGGLKELLDRWDYHQRQGEVVT
ncbi:unnamed protein product [Boreogadus saida]